MDDFYKKRDLLQLKVSKDETDAYFLPLVNNDNKSKPISSDEAVALLEPLYFKHMKSLISGISVPLGAHYDFLLYQMLLAKAKHLWNKFLKQENIDPASEDPKIKIDKVF